MRFTLIRQIILTLTAISWLGCGRAAVSDTQGLSAQGSTHNAAVLIQGNLTEAANDIRLLDDVLAADSANYGFAIRTELGATSGEALAAIGDGASQVDADGTLFVYMGGHGSPDGGSQMNDGRLVRYGDIRNAIGAAAAQTFKRLVLVVFGCYSGSWIGNIDRAGDRPDAEATPSEIDARRAYEALAGTEGTPLFEELLVMTSSSAGQLSYYTPGGTSHLAAAFSKSFASLEGDADATIGDLVDGVESRVTSSTVASAVSPAGLRDEPLLNAD